jgi:hypothetical protein
VIDVIKNKVFNQNLLLLLIVIVFSTNSIADSDISLSLTNNGNASPDEQCVTYERINPAIYLVKADCKDGNYILSFKELYSPGWKVYFNLATEENSKINYSFMENYIVESFKDNKIEYKIEEKITPSIRNSVLLPDDSHYRLNNKFNGWVIDTQLINYLKSSSRFLNDSKSYDSSYSFYIVFYSEIIKQFWQNVMLSIIALLLIIFFGKKLITRIY